MQPTETTYAELRLAYDAFNERLFEGELPACLLTLQREKRTYGYFSRDRFGMKSGQTTDEIALNPEYFAVVPLVETLQTIAHEMTHLWQAHFGTPGRGRYHNAEWADKMESIGLMPSATGRPGGRRVGDRMADYPIEGGRFVGAVADLVGTRGFGISWFDRFAPARVLYPTVEPCALEELPTAALAVAAECGVQVRTDVFAPSPVNRSNRVRYTCAGCGLNLWGKPGVRVACVECGMELEAGVSAEDLPAKAGRSNRCGVLGQRQTLVNGGAR